MLNKLFIALVLVSISVLGFDKVYFLPNDALLVKKDISRLLKNSTKKIDIAMYNFSYKKFSKIINKQSKNGLDINIFYNKSKLKFNKKIKAKQPTTKLHIKLAIIADKYLIFGTANWTKKSFQENYEIINITDDKVKIDKFIKIFKKLKDEN
jgi:phosphatidylserine/phosphatidylglycerophosphate/cardiolipin synthase-like enzyme